MKEECVGWLDDEWNTVLDQSQPIVRCRDCADFDECIMTKTYSDGSIDEKDHDGFCAWGNRVEFVTCKCGEELEAFGRVRTCPSCGRRLMA